MASATARVGQVAQPERLVLVNPEFDLLLACCADATALARTQRIQSLLQGKSIGISYFSLPCNMA